MLLTHETTIVLNKNDANIVGHMCCLLYTSPSPRD